MDRLLLLPEQASLKVSMGLRGARAALDGPSGRYGKAVARGIFTVDAEWYLDQTEYQQWLDFYNDHQATPFLITLQVYTVPLTDYKAVWAEKYSAQIEGELYKVRCAMQCERMNA